MRRTSAGLPCLHIFILKLVNSLELTLSESKMALNIALINQFICVAIKTGLLIKCRPMTLFACIAYSLPAWSVCELLSMSLC